MMHGQKNVKLF